MTTVDQGGRVHDRAGRFAGHVHQEAAGGTQSLQAPAPAATREQERARAIFAAVQSGKTVFTKPKDGAWLIVGPADTITDGALVEVHKKDGTTTRVKVGAAGPVLTKQDVAYRVATFSDAPAARTARPAAPPRTVEAPRESKPWPKVKEKGKCWSCGHRGRVFLVADMSGVGGYVCWRCTADDTHSWG